MARNRTTRVESNSTQTEQAALVTLAHEFFASAYTAKGEQDKAAQAKEGYYTIAARLFDSKASVVTLRATLEAVEGEYRSGQMAGCPVILGKANKKTGERSPVLPSGYKSAKSVLLDASTLGISVPAPASFGAIRKAVKAAKDKQAEAAMTDADKARASILAELGAIMESIKDGSTPARMFPTIEAWLADYVNLAAPASAHPVDEAAELAEAA